MNFRGNFKFITSLGQICSNRKGESKFYGFAVHFIFISLVIWQTIIIKIRITRRTYIQIYICQSDKLIKTLWATFRRVCAVIKARTQRLLRRTIKNCEPESIKNKKSVGEWCKSRRKLRKTGVFVIKLMRREKADLFFILFYMVGINNIDCWSL